MTKSTTVTLRGLLLGAVLATSLGGCGWDFSGDVDNKQPEESNRRQSRTHSAYDDSYGSIFGEDGLTLFGGSEQTASVDPGIGVNSYLWRASLDTIAFMPLTSADPFGGVLITDWYTPPATPNERLKVTIYILSRDLRADGIKATVFRQSMVSGQWVDQAVDQQTATDLEDAILTRARQLRIGNPTG